MSSGFILERECIHMVIWPGTIRLHVKNPVKMIAIPAKFTRYNRVCPSP